MTSRLPTGAAKPNIGKRIERSETAPVPASKVCSDCALTAHPASVRQAARDAGLTAELPSNIDSPPPIAALCAERG